MAKLNKICQNTLEKNVHCSGCGFHCCDDKCDQSICEIIIDSHGKKKMTCMCPGTTCVCLNRTPSLMEFQSHLIEVYCEAME